MCVSKNELVSRQSSINDCHICYSYLCCQSENIEQLYLLACNQKKTYKKKLYTKIMHRKMRTLTCKIKQLVTLRFFQLPQMRETDLNGSLHLRTYILYLAFSAISDGSVFSVIYVLSFWLTLGFREFNTCYHHHQCRFSEIFNRGGINNQWQRYMA